MKLFSIILILIALFGLLAYSNPKLDNYDQFISQRITEETRAVRRINVGWIRASNPPKRSLHSLIESTAIKCYHINILQLCIC